MSLQEKLGQELYDQVVEKLGDEKIAIVSDGSYIPKQKFDDKNDEVKDLKQQLADRDNDLNDLKKKAKDHQELQDEIDTLKQQYDDTKNDYEQKLQQKTFDYELEKALRDANAKNPKAVKALLDADTIKLDGDKLLGLDEQLKNLQESDEYLFKQEEPQKLGGRDPHPSNPNETKEPQKNPFSKEHFNLTEQARLLKDDPELAKQLKAKAK